MAKNDIVISIGLKGFKKFNNDLKSASHKMRRFGQNMKRNGQQMTQSITLPIVAIGAASVKMGVDFENSMNKIVGQVGIAREEVEGMRKDFIRVSRETGKSMNELGDAMFFVQSAGLRGADAVEALEISARASAAGMGETKVIADLLTSAINAYGKENLDAALAGDILAAAVREGKAEASQLAASMGQVLPIASEMGVSFDQVAAAQAAMTRTGTDAATASTQLRQILFTIKNPSQEARAQLKEMGLSAAGLRRQVKEDGLLATLQTLTDTFGDNEEATAKVFGNVRALSGVLDLMGANAEENTGIFERLKDANGSLAIAFAETDGTGRLLNQVYNELQILLLSLYDSISEYLIPVLKSLRSALQQTTEFWQSLSDKTKGTTIKMAAVLAIIGPLLMAVGAVTSAIAAMGLALVAVTIKITAIIVAIGSFVAAIMYAYANWEAIKERFSNISWWRNALISMVQFFIEWNPLAMLTDSMLKLINFFREDPLPNPFETISKQLDKLRADNQEYETEFKGFGESMKIAAKDAAKGIGFLKDEWTELANMVKSTSPYLIEGFQGFEKKEVNIPDFLKPGSGTKPNEDDKDKPTPPIIDPDDTKETLTLLEKKKKKLGEISKEIKLAILAGEDFGDLKREYVILKKELDKIEEKFNDIGKTSSFTDDIIKSVEEFGPNFIKKVSDISKKANDAVLEGLAGLQAGIKINPNAGPKSKGADESKNEEPEWYKRLTKYVGMAKDVLNDFFSLWGELQANKEAKARMQYEAELERIKNSTMSEKAKERAIQKLNEERDKQERKLARKKAVREKAQALFGAILSTAQAVAKALTAGPILGPILASVIGAMGAAKIGVISSQPLPALAEGGLAYGPTQALVGDNPNAGVDPEVISPLSKLKKYMGDGDQRVRVDGGSVRVRGQDLIIALEAAQVTRSRV